MKKSLFLLAACLLLSASAFAQTQPKMSKDEQQLRALLNGTAEGWNRGDLPKYLSVYTPDATEMRGTGPAGGVEAIEETMKKGFWKTGKPLQTLRYESVVVRMLGKEAALVTGNYILTGGNIPERKGWFTSVWRKTKNGWRMIHDHS